MKGLLVGRKDEAELMKTLITEPSYRLEKKFMRTIEHQVIIITAGVYCRSLLQESIADCVMLLT